MGTTSAFRNQRTRFRNPSPPYAEKTLDHPRWLFPSRKLGRQVMCWTKGEYRAVVAFETASTTVLRSYEERPELVMLRDGPDWYRYTPSFMVNLQGGPIIVELSALGAPKNSRQLILANLAHDHFAQRGIRFAEISHQALHAQPRAAGADLLVRYLAVVILPSEVLQARDVLAQAPASIARVELATGVRRERLMAMVLRGDLELLGPPPFNLASLLTIPNEGGRS